MPHEPKKSDRVEVYWPLDKTYYPGTIISCDSEKGKYEVQYDDGDHENLNLSSENGGSCRIKQNSVLPSKRWKVRYVASNSHRESMS